MKEIIRYFDCFAGIGGFHCGAQEITSDRYEFSHVAFCEIEKKAQKVYEATCVNGSVQTTYQTLLHEFRPDSCESVSFEHHQSFVRFH